MFRCACVICALYIFLISGVNAQRPQKIWFDKTDTTYGFFSVIEPLSKKYKGAIVLLDGFGGNALSFLEETGIDNCAYTDGFLIVTIPTGMRLYADDAIIRILNKSLRQVSEKYHIPQNKFAIGGFSAGGVIALRYAELCSENITDYAIKPAAIFTVDAPVDLEGLYDRAKEDLERVPNSLWGEERNMIVSVFEKAVGITGVDKSGFKKINPFSVKSKAMGNEKFLLRLPYRTYHDVDVNWGLKERQRSIYGMNMLDASELVRRLILGGNTKAEFIQSKIIGMRSNGLRHPHAWNIVDAPELIEWIEKSIN
ncbi:hypothetical protein ACTJIJ_00520 [Niabella sp. 22666]|uniref:hypothetical protein n=1 Tax=Niabella sp. 22666 TaxID=3453954 RepID=UPI003F845942